MNRNGKKIFRKFLRQLAWLLPSPKEGNVKAIFLSILIATTFWFFNALNKSDYSTSINYPIAFDYDQDSTYLLSQLPENITVEISGGGWNLLKKTLLFDRPPVRITLDSPTSTKFIDVASISSLVRNKLEDVSLDDIVTDTLFLNIDKTSSKKVSLALDTSQVNLAEQHRIVSNIKISPEIAQLAGPASIITKIPDTVYVTMPDEVISDNFSEDLPIAISNLEHIQVEPEEASVSFEVAPFSLYEKEVSVSPVNFPADSSISLNKEYVKISFWLQNNYVELANNYIFQVVANFRTLNTKDSTVIPVLKSYPDFAKDITITPSKVEVKYAE